MTFYFLHSAVYLHCGNVKNYSPTMRCWIKHLPEKGATNRNIWNCCFTFVPCSEVSCPSVFYCEIKKHNLTPLQTQSEHFYWQLIELKIVSISDIQIKSNVSNFIIFPTYKTELHPTNMDTASTLRARSPLKLPTENKLRPHHSCTLDILLVLQYKIDAGNNIICFPRSGTERQIELNK